MAGAISQSVVCCRREDLSSVPLSPCFFSLFVLSCLKRKGEKAWCGIMEMEINGSL